ncbi:hypothetical protein [Ralstonia solanacearum]|uniref:hypothetical protein n=1 Tax=Ralstonia solanacearum TaxID=305 RepID=UPI0001D95442|nr:hypothetical protein [Ralstonia solanacearum]CBJ42543.1 conserved protein of unknown function [Ralstonia solanacearum CFBP2957]
MKTARKFTCDALIRRAVAKRKAATRKPDATTVDAKSARQPVDLNEIHRRFWAKLAGKE